MESIVKFNDLKLIIESKNNKVVSYVGSDLIKKMVSKFFNCSIEVSVPQITKFTMGTKVKKLKPGQKGYIQAVLIEIIQNELNMDVFYNIKEENKDA